MCTKGSSRLMSTPAKARRTGNPSPSKPDGAVVTESTGRSTVVAGSGRGMRGRVSGLSTVTAGMGNLLPGTIPASAIRQPSVVDGVEDQLLGVAEAGLELRRHLAGDGRRQAAAVAARPGAAGDPRQPRPPPPRR